MHGPWYHIEEACEILDVRRSELDHLISEGKLRPVVFASERPLLLTSRDKDGNWIGRASCRYRGHLLMHPKTIQPLLDGTAINSQASMRILEPASVTHWNSQYPFKKPSPISPLADWQPAPHEMEIIPKLGALPFPKESVSTGSALSRAAKHLEKALDSKNNGTRYEMKELFPIEDNVLFFNQHNLFNPEDVRIPRSEIDSYLNPKEETKSIKKSAKLDQKENQFHTLLYRIIQFKPEIKAKEAWALLEREFKSDDPQFDIDGIIQAISPGELEWISKHGNTSYQKYNSFSVTLSKVKRKLKEMEAI